MRIAGLKPVGGTEAASLAPQKMPLNVSAPEFVWAGKVQRVTRLNPASAEFWPVGGMTSGSASNHAAPEFLPPWSRPGSESSRASWVLSAPDFDGAADEQHHPGQEDLAQLFSAGCGVHPEECYSSHASTCMQPSGTLNAAAAEFVPTAASRNCNALLEGLHSAGQGLRLSSSAPDLPSMHPMMQQEEACGALMPSDGHMHEWGGHLEEGGEVSWHGMHEDASATWEPAFQHGFPTPTSNEQDPGSGVRWVMILCVTTPACMQ